VIRGILVATTALTAVLLAGTSAQAQTLTFSSTSLSDWQCGYSWAPGGNLGAELLSFWPGTDAIPADANPVSSSASGLQLAVFPVPPDFTAGGAPLMGALVTTHGTFSQLYGYFQATIKMPATAGTMGAFWLLPANGAWPPEIDIVEALANQPTTLFTTAHSSTQSAQEQGVTQVANVTAGFHTYAVDWEANTVTWYFDGQQVYQIATPADMHVPMYILLDTGAGTCGSWEGCPASNNILAAMQVSSVEAWTSNPHLPPPAVVAQAAPLGVPASNPGPDTSILATVDARTRAEQQQTAADEAAAQQQIAAAQAAPQAGAALIRQGDALAARADGILAGVMKTMGKH
jgi:hypothetical protein